MKPIIFLFLFSISVALLSCSEQSSANTDTDADIHEHEADAEPETTAAKKPLSPRTNAMANIGEAHVHIDYSSPGVRGRTIWGGLVAYDQVWVTGAHKATSIDFSKAVMIDGQKIEAGTYGFFTIPGREKWILIINKNHEQHLADDYDKALDVLRIEVTPESLDAPVESLTYEIKPTDENKGIVSVMWDRIKVSFEVQTL